MIGSVLFYVQHLLGIGHLKRALRIVDALTREGVEVTVVSGGEPVAAVASAITTQIVQLPPIRARDADFRELVDAADRLVNEDLRIARREALLEALAAARPDAVLIEAFPFGRRAFRFELDALIDAARSRLPRPLVLCSLRDIVVLHDKKRGQEIVDRVRADFDFVLVHSDPRLVPLEASFPAAPEISDRLVYTGYVAATDTLAEASPPAPGSDDAAGLDEVVVSVGGGAVGGALLSSALETRRRGYLTGLKWRLLTGPNLPEPQFEALASNLPERVTVERYRREFPQILRRCHVSVSQGGYNTVMDVLEARAPAVVVPFASERETEQSLRAERLAACGILEVVQERELSPERLVQAIDRAISRPSAPIVIDTGGARRTASLIVGMINSARGLSRAQ